MKKRYIAIIIFVLILGAFGYASTFTVKDIEITGCEVVDAQVVHDAIKEEAPLDNTLLLCLKGKLNQLGEIPFISKMDIEFTGKHSVSVMVYEKSMAGCVEYMNSYVYFDKDGVVLDASDKMVDGVPCIKGLTFSQWEMGEKLPISDEKKFQSILTITQLVDKYGLDIDGIKFTAENEIILTHKEITIELGEGEYLAVQMMNLGSILENLEGMSGTLYMKDFDSENATASFSKK